MAASRVLIVEDERIVAEEVARSLVSLGYQIAGVVHSGEEAVRQAEETSPDIVLMDIVLEGSMDGIEAADLIRSRVNIPIIYLTAYADTGSVGRAKLTEPYGYLIKPFSQQELLSTIELALYKNQTERLLKESERFNRGLVEHSPMAIIYLGKDGTIEYGNPATKLMFGISEGEELPLLGATIFGLNFMNDQPDLVRRFELLMNGEPQSDMEIAYHSPFSGEDFTLLTSATPRLSAEGSVTGAIVMFVDITERKRVEEDLQKAHDELERRVHERTRELVEANEKLKKEIEERLQAEESQRRSEERFRAIFEAAQDCIFIKDENLRYVQVNPAFERTLGVKGAWIIGQTDEAIFDPRTCKNTKAVDQRVLRGEIVEQEHTTKVNGANLTFLDIRVPLRNPSGEITGMCGISRNITERKLAGPTEHISAGDYLSKAMRTTLEQARLAADKGSIVLLLGESGSGKDYLARWIHKHSSRANGLFLALNCAAISKDLAESELFGHEAGAFTGAIARKKGLLELAEGGTLLLNEIGELPLSLQSKLLTFLDTRSFLRVGGEKDVRVDARLIAATHRDLESEIAQGRFLEPLFYRLNVYAIAVPPLRDRIDDIPILVEEIMRKLAAELQLTQIPTTQSADLRALSDYHWPGNVRELRNVVERALMVSDLVNFRISLPERKTNQEDPIHSLRFRSDHTLRDMTDEITKWACVCALDHTEGNRSEAARLLGISRESIYRHMRRLGIQ